MAMKQENPFKPYAWLLGPVGGLIAAFILSAVNSPVDRLSKLEDRTKVLELAKAADDVERRGQVAAFAKMEAQVTLLVTAVNELKLEVRDLRKK